MNENSFEWFQQKTKQVEQEIQHWPTWMKSSLDVATASFPQVPTDDESSARMQEKKSEAPKAGL